MLPMLLPAASYTVVPSTRSLSMSGLPVISRVAAIAMSSSSFLHWRGSLRVSAYQLRQQGRGLGRPRWRGPLGKLWCFRSFINVREPILVPVRPGADMEGGVRRAKCPAARSLAPEVGGLDDRAPQFGFRLHAGSQLFRRSRPASLRLSPMRNV